MVQEGTSATCADVDGKLTGGDAVKFFERSGLPRELLAKVCMHASLARLPEHGIAAAVLVDVKVPRTFLYSQVWSLSDSARRGFLDVRTFSKASKTPASRATWLTTTAMPQLCHACKCLCGHLHASGLA